MSRPLCLALEVNDRDPNNIEIPEGHSTHAFRVCVYIYLSLGTFVNDVSARAFICRFSSSLHAMDFLPFH